MSLLCRPGCGFSLAIVAYCLAGCGDSDATHQANPDANTATAGNRATTDSIAGAPAGLAGATGSLGGVAGTLGYAGAAPSTVKETRIIDDAEDGDEANALGGKWITYDDSWDGGKSLVAPPAWSNAIPFAMSAPGYGGVGYAAKIAGTTNPSLSFAYIGMLTTLGPNSLCPDPEPPAVTLASYQGVRFKAKGHMTGGSWVLILSHRKEGAVDNCKNPIIGDTLTNWGDYRFDFTDQLTDDWSTITIDWHKDLFAPAWGQPAALELVLEHAKDIVWQYENGLGGEAELWIDDVELVR